ncbi:hypothetical protein M440DRAFT_74265 [Trichoderma longibrachiatum ATCC 18648]|uniref:Uncharacterized protein n=1 Tax=Trichoderma longibrachiatum ATCC 18648 TaxID=983965 RepID=A0A2T4CHI4_TRILO|nr:hypothetical protein M440DRAFT_74265 [Trichoderma longibrachiatum ATCC 18648]
MLGEAIPSKLGKRKQRQSNKEAATHLTGATISKICIMTEKRREENGTMLTVGQTATKRKSKLPATLFPVALTDQKPVPCATLNDTHPHTMIVGKGRKRWVEEAHETTSKERAKWTGRIQRVGKMREEHLRLQFVLVIESRPGVDVAPRRHTSLIASDSA